MWLRLLRQLDDIIPAPRPNNGLLPEVRSPESTIDSKGLDLRPKTGKTGGLQDLQGLNRPVWVENDWPEFEDL